MDFKNANELLALCEEKNLPISEIMRIREIELGETASEIVNKKMTRVLGIMKDAAFSPIRQTAFYETKIIKCGLFFVRTDCDAHLAESLFQTRSRERMAVQFDLV